MDINTQRSAAIKLATEAGAARTLAILKSDQYHDISAVLRTAANEVGVDKLVAGILKVHPAWAGDALRFIPDLGSHRTQLVNAICDNKVAVVHGTSGAGALNLAAATPAGSLELYLASGAAMEAWFTMFWIHNGVGYPQAITGDINQWLWSQELSISINRSATIRCADFATHIKAPLAAGDSVWMVERSCSQNFDTGFRFVYQPGGPTVQIDVVGGALTPSFSIPNDGSARMRAGRAE
jgi:hypothetical protein